MPSDDDAELLKRMSEADSEAARLLQEKYRHRLILVIKRRLSSFPPATTQRFDEEDVLQDAWMTAITRASSYRGDGSVFLWLRRICVDQTLTSYRRHVKASKRSVTRDAGAGVFSIDSTGQLADHLIGSFTTASNMLHRTELRARLASKIDSMDEKDREVVLLRHYEELTNQEVAELLDLTPQAASVRYTRALARLGEISADLTEYLD